MTALEAIAAFWCILGAIVFTYVGVRLEHGR